MAASSRPHPGFTAAQVDLTFPFHLLLGKDLRIGHLGPSLARICPDVAVGNLLNTHFELLRPEVQPTFEGLRSAVNYVTLWQHRASGLRLRGQTLPTDDMDSLILLWKPWVEDNAELLQHGLQLNDFALHDAIPDMLQVIQAQKIAFQDVRKLAQKLQTQRAELTRTHQDLQEQYELLSQSRENLAKKEEETRKLAMIAACTDNVVILTDALGRVEWVNAAFSQTTGYTLEEVRGNTPGKILQGPQSDPWVINYMAKQLERGLGYKAELINYTKSGQPYWIQIEVQPIINEQGDITHFIAIERDTTEARNFRESLKKATEQAKAANAAKSEFLSNMSHEIRTPMNAVLGLAQLLKREPLTETQGDMVRRILAAGQSLLAILNDVLDFSKIEAGHLRLDQHPFDLADVLDKLDGLTRATALERGLEFHIHPGPGIEGLWLGDALRLEQVLLNLVSNAVKFTEQGSVSVAVTRLEAHPERSRFGFEVRDTGVGIPAEALTKLFMPFTQADSSISRRFGGTGLGLAISRQLVQLMGGKIEVESQEGVGSRFRFELPLCPAGESATRPEDPTPETIGQGPRLMGLRVLAVDDSRMNLDVVERVLTAEGAIASLAADGQQAINLLHSQPDGFDIVLMDLQMPVMDGMTATRTIRRELGLLDLPILAFTAGVLETQRAAAIKAGLNDFLAKPIEIEALVAMIQRWTTRQLPVPPPSRAEFPPDTGESSRLPAIPGIDRERAAQTLGQDRDFFLDLLGRLIADYANATERLRGHLAAGQTDDAARLLHTLKSNAGNLGAMPLVNATRALETALLEGQADLEAPLTAFSRELDALIQASRAWIRRTEPAS